MQEQYSLELTNNHLIVSVKSNKYLIDTGSPSSFARDGMLSLGAREYPVEESLVTLTADSLSTSIESPVDGLLGTDILNDFYTVFDLSQGTMIVSDEELSIDGDVVEIRLFMHIPIITVKVGEEKLDCFLDTGAPVSYCQAEWIEKYESTGTYADFYPLIGIFETQVYQVEYRIGKQDYVLKTGKLPEMLALALQMGSADGILGNELLLNHKIGYFPARNQIVIG